MHAYSFKLTVAIELSTNNNKKWISYCVCAHFPVKMPRFYPILNLCCGHFKSCDTSFFESFYQQDLPAGHPENAANKKDYKLLENYSLLSRLGMTSGFHTCIECCYPPYDL